MASELIREDDEVIYGDLTDKPKDIVLKVYFDKETAEKLDECIAELEVSKSEAVRRGIHKVHDDLKRK